MAEPINATIAVLAHYIEDCLVNFECEVTEAYTSDMSHVLQVTAPDGNAVTVIIDRAA